MWREQRKGGAKEGVGGSEAPRLSTLISSEWKMSASSGLSIKILGLSPSLAPPELSLRAVLWPPWRSSAARSLLVLPMAGDLRGGGGGTTQGNGKGRAGTPHPRGPPGPPGPRATPLGPRARALAEPRCTCSGGSRGYNSDQSRSVT